MSADNSWNTVWRDIEFDPRSGAASTIDLPAPRSDTSVPSGFAHYERSLFGHRQVFALFKVADMLFFSVGARRWQLDRAGLQFVHSHPFPFLSRFRVVESGQTVFSITYSHVRRLLFALIDPTYDKIDEESDFFLAFVAEYAQSPEWQANARQRWASEPAV